MCFRNKEPSLSSAINQLDLPRRCVVFTVRYEVTFCRVLRPEIIQWYLSEAFKGRSYIFTHFSQNCEKRLLASSFLSVCLSARPSVLPHGTTRLPLDGYSRNLIFEYFSKICQENSRLIKIWQQYRVLSWRPVCVFWCVCVCVRACMRACMRVCVCAYVCMVYDMIRYISISGTFVKTVCVCVCVCVYDISRYVCVMWYMIWYMVYDMIWYGMVWYMIWWHDMTWYDMIWYDMIWYDMIWYDMIWYDMLRYDIWYDIWYDMIWYDMIWYDMIWYDMIWYDMILYLA